MGFIKSKTDAQERANNFQPVPVPQMDFGYDQKFFEEPEENEFYEEDEEDYSTSTEFDITPDPVIDEAPKQKLVLSPPKRKRPNLNLAPPRKS